MKLSSHSSIDIRNLKSAIRNPQCSGRDSNSDHALIWCWQGISLLLCQLSYRSKSNNWCARRDSNPPPRFKRPVLRHQSFGRMVLAAGVEPALTALEEQRLFRSATPAIQAGMKGLEPSIAWSTTRCIGRFATSPWQRRRDSNPQSPVRETGGLATLPTTP